MEQVFNDNIYQKIFSVCLLLVVVVCHSFWFNFTKGGLESGRKNFMEFAL